MAIKFNAVTKFNVTLGLIFILMLTAGSLIPVSSPAFVYAPYVKLILLPFALTYVIVYARRYVPSMYETYRNAALAAAVGITLSTIIPPLFLG